MAYEISEYKGDNKYSVNCTGDVVMGDEVSFERATFSGSFRNAKFAGFELIQGKIINDSYGRDKQQHTFTIELLDGSKMTIKGRNLYANGTYRKLWDNEDMRGQVADEKHERGAKARKAREYRLENGF